VISSVFHKTAGEPIKSANKDTIPNLKNEINFLELT